MLAGFQQFIVQAATAFPTMSWDNVEAGMGDYNNDGRADLLMLPGQA